MSDRPTPETDFEKQTLEEWVKEYEGTLAENNPPWYLIHEETAKKLERERDEARERAANWESSSDAMERAGAEQARRADENREWALRAERERDEARERLHKVLKVLDDYDQAIKNPSSPFWEAFKKWFTWEAGK